MMQHEEILPGWRYRRDGESLFRDVTSIIDGVVNYTVAEVSASMSQAEFAAWATSRIRISAPW